MVKLAHSMPEEMLPLVFTLIQRYFHIYRIFTLVVI